MESLMHPYVRTCRHKWAPPYLVNKQSTDSDGFSTAGWHPASPVLMSPTRTLPLLVSLTKHRNSLGVAASAEEHTTCNLC